MTRPPLLHGPFRIDPEDNSLRRDGVPVAIGQRAQALFRCLVEAAGETVSKETLMDAAWPDTVVEEGNLTVQVAALRKAVGTDSDGNDWIVTVPRQGYRLLKPHRAVANADVEPPSLAVLPFRNLGDDPEFDYFVDGIVDDIISLLTRFRSFSVVSRDASFAYRDRADTDAIATELGVQYVLTGSLRRSGDQLRLTAQLADTESGRQIWSDRFDGAATEVFDFQDRIAEAVATGIVPEIETSELARARQLRPGSLAAYDVVLEARHLIATEGREENERALAMLEGAIEQHPQDPHLLSTAAFALEHRITVAWNNVRPGDRDRCGELARRALEKADGNPQIMAQCGIVLLQGAREYEWGMAILASAYEANPNHTLICTAYGVGNLHCGEPGEALACFERVYTLSPRDWVRHIAYCGSAHAHILQGDYKAARDFAGKSLALRPRYEFALIMMAAACALLDEREEAARYAAQLSALIPGCTVALFRDGQPDFEPDRMNRIWDGLRTAGVPEG